MSKPVTKSAQLASKKTKSNVATKTRILQPAKRVAWKPKTWRRTRETSFSKLPKARLILTAAVRSLLAMRKTVLGISIVYGLGILLFARALSAGVDSQALSDTVSSVATNIFQARAIELGVLFNSGNAAASTSGTIFQVIFFVICSLALIWALRSSHAKHQTSTKAAFYQGMGQIIPFSLVLLVFSLQLLPLVLSSYLYSSLIYNGIAVTASEQFIAFVVIALIALWSLRMVTTGIFASYIASLPGMTPVASLRSARDLVRGRRLLIWRKLILLPVVISLATIIIVLPFLFVWPAAAVWVFYFASILWLPILHSYFYELYREMIKK